jgi:hypothetical protein
MVTTRSTTEKGNYLALEPETAGDRRGRRQGRLPFRRAAAAGHLTTAEIRRYFRKIID